MGQELSNWCIDEDGLNQVNSLGHKLHIFGFSFSSGLKRMFPLAMEVHILYKIGYWKKRGNKS